MEPTRVIFIGPVPPHRGGIAQHSLQVVRALRDIGADVKVVTWRSMYPGWLHPGTTLRVRKPADGIALLTWWNPIGWFRAGLLARKSHVVVVPWIGPFQALQLRVFDLVARRPLVVLVHNVVPHEPFPFGDALTRWALRPVSRFVVHSRTVASELECLGLSQPTALVPHPSNLVLRRQPLPAFPPYRLLSFGFVRPYKGVDLAIRALWRVRSAGWNAELSIVGEVWDGGTELQQLVSDLGLTEQVRIESRYVPDEEVSRIFAEHHALVASYRSASQSGAVALALAAGRPAVVTPVGGLADMIEDRRTGVVASAVDAESISDALVVCMSNLGKLASGASGGEASWRMVASEIVGGGAGHVGS